MNQLKTAVLGFAFITFVATGTIRTASAATDAMSDSDHKMMSSCMAMSSEAMMKDSSCSAMMKKMNMSESDMKMMKTCMGMAQDAMMKDTECSSMMKMHPDMMKSEK